MQEPLITSRANPLVKEIKAYTLTKRRRREGRCLLEGPKLVGEALAQGAEVERVVLEVGKETAPPLRRIRREARRLGIPVSRVSASVMTDLSDVESSQGVVAVIRVPETVLALSRIAQGDLAVALWGVQDPGNLGAILRVASAAGAGGVVTGEGTADLYHPRVLRGAAGAHFLIPAVEVDDLSAWLDRIRSRFQRVATAPASGPSYLDVDFTRPTLFLLGAEGGGLPEEALRHADLRVRIPMAQGVESLNVAVAAGILLYEAVRQRGAIRSR
jgi:TrmH family RNA methyltransferase